MADVDQDFELYQGDAKTLSFTLTTPDAGLTSPIAVWGFGKSPNIPLLFTIPNTRISVTQNAGVWTCAVQLIPQDTAGVRWGEYYHELRVGDDSGVVPDVVATGTMSLLASPIGRGG